MLKTILKWISNIIIMLLALIVLLAVFSTIQSRRNPGQVPSILGYSPMSVLTGSMQPLFKPGDMIIIKNINADRIKIGDIITFKIPSGTLVTHRVVDIIKTDSTLSFKTRGDANNAADGMLVTVEQIIGKQILKIPYGGYAVRFVREPAGYVIFIVIPLLLLLFSEIRKAVSLSVERKRETLKKKVVNK